METFQLSESAGLGMGLKASVFSPERCETESYTVAQMHGESCRRKPRSSAFLLREKQQAGEHHLFRHASCLWVWLLLFFLLLESTQLSSISECLGLRGKAVEIFCLVEARTLAAAVSEPAPSLLLKRSSIPLSCGTSHLRPTSLGHFLHILPPLGSWAASCKSSCGWTLPELPLWVSRVC